MSTKEITGLFFALFFLYICGLGTGLVIGKRFTQQREIEAGVAEFQVDKKTGITKLVFLTNGVVIKNN